MTVGQAGEMLTTLMEVGPRRFGRVSVMVLRGQVVGTEGPKVLVTRGLESVQLIRLRSC